MQAIVVDVLELVLGFGQPLAGAGTRSCVCDPCCPNWPLSTNTNSNEPPLVAWQIAIFPAGTEEVVETDSDWMREGQPSAGAGIKSPS